MGVAHFSVCFEIDIKRLSWGLPVFDVSFEIAIERLSWRLPVLKFALKLLQKYCNGDANLLCVL